MRFCARMKTCRLAKSGVANGKCKLKKWRGPQRSEDTVFEGSEGLALGVREGGALPCLLSVFLYAHAAKHNYNYNYNYNFASIICSKSSFQWLLPVREISLHRNQFNDFGVLKVGLRYHAHRDRPGTGRNEEACGSCAGCKWENTATELTSEVIAANDASCSI